MSCTTSSDWNEPSCHMASTPTMVPPASGPNALLGGAQGVSLLLGGAVAVVLSPRAIYALAGLLGLAAAGAVALTSGAGTAGAIAATLGTTSPSRLPEPARGSHP